jgi:hypothetical protein
MKTIIRPLLTLLLPLVLGACKLNVQVMGDGAGSVASNPNGIQCSTTDTACSMAFRGKPIELTATPAPGSRFDRWSGDCTGSNPVCRAMGPANLKVTAHFRSEEALTLDCGTDGAKAGCLSPKFPPEYYIEQSIKYFRTMESSVSVLVQPNYSPLVVRWEWPPWLMLTGFTRFNLIWTDILLKLHPTKYKEIDCRFFDKQPFGRCRVVFDYSGELCPIYEEFTFNDQGEMTFIEAWSDYPGLVPMRDPADSWAEGDAVDRLATRVPGLGNAQGLIDLKSTAMLTAAGRDADVADLVRRANKPYKTYFDELAANAQAVANGCKPPPGVAPTKS